MLFIKKLYISASFSVSEYAGMLMIRTQLNAYILLGFVQHDAPLRPLILLQEHQWLLLDVWFCLLQHNILSL